MPPERLGEDAPAPKRQRKRSRQEDAPEKEDGGRYIPHYEDTHGRHKLVTMDDLREVRGFGIAQQILFGSGAFFFSGAFWEMVRTVAEQPHFEFTPWMMVYVISMVAGGMLASVGVYLFLAKQRRLDKYFPRQKKDGDASNPE